MLADLQTILHHEEAIQTRIAELAQQITRDYQGRELTAIALLNGSLLFAADLLRRIPLPLHIDALRVSSYHGDRSTGRVHFHHPLPPALAGRHLLLIDDILDTGTTLAAVRERLLQETTPASLRTCVLLRKNIHHPRYVEADYIGFDIPDAFVVGYGLDYHENYRNLPYIGVLTEEAIHRPM